MPRFGLRQVRRNPMFSGLAIATLALGIAGVAAMFSAVNTILIRPLPYADADRLVMIWDDLAYEGIAKHFPAPAEMLAWRAPEHGVHGHRVHGTGGRYAFRR